MKWAKSGTLPCRLPMDVWIHNQEEVVINVVLLMDSRRLCACLKRQCSLMNYSDINPT